MAFVTALGTEKKECRWLITDVLIPGARKVLVIPGRRRERNHSMQ